MRLSACRISAERPAALGFEHDLGPRIAGLFDDLQDGAAVLSRVKRQIDIRHPPAEFADNFISAKLLEVQHGPNLFCAKALRVALTSDDLRRDGGSSPVFPGIQARTLEPLNVIRGADRQVSHKTDH